MDWFMVTMIAIIPLLVLIGIMLYGVYACKKHPHKK